MHLSKERLAYNSQMSSEESYISRAYRDIALLLDSHKSSLNKSMISFYLYDKSAILERIAQAVSLELTDSFLSKILNKKNEGKDYSYHAKLEIFHCGKLNIYPVNGAITPGNKLVVSCVTNLLFLWGYVMYCFFKSAFNKKNNFGPAVLIHGVPAANLLNEGGCHFENFCTSGNIELLTHAKKYIVQIDSSTKIANKKNFIYDRYPLLALLSHNQYSFSERIKFLWNHIKILFGFIWTVFKNPIMCLLWRDYGLHSSAMVLNEKFLIKENLITNTNWLQQYLWMSNLPGKNFKTHLALYSLNSGALRYKGVSALANHPGIKLLRVDSILSWGSYYEQALREECIYSPVLNVGPILWTLPDKKSQRQIKTKSKINICLFDVTPKRNRDFKKLELVENYYSLENCKLFVSETISAVKAVEADLKVIFEIKIKHKRKISGFEDDLYLTYIDELVESSEKIKLLPEDSNLWTIVANCDLVVAIPYTSPAYVAEYLGIDAVFFDPSGLLDNGVYRGAKINFSSNRNELINIIRECIISSNENS